MIPFSTRWFYHPSDPKYIGNTVPTRRVSRWGPFQTAGFDCDHLNNQPIQLIQVMEQPNGAALADPSSSPESDTAPVDWESFFRKDGSDGSEIGMQFLGPAPDIEGKQGGQEGLLVPEEPPGMDVAAKPPDVGREVVPFAFQISAMEHGPKEKLRNHFLSPVPTEPAESPFVGIHQYPDYPFPSQPHDHGSHSPHNPNLAKRPKDARNLWTEDELRKTQHQRHNGLIRQVDRLLDGYHELQRLSRNEGIVLRSLMDEEAALKGKIKEGRGSLISSVCFLPSE